MEVAVEVASTAGLDLLKAALATVRPDENVFISSYNILVGLVALMVGTKGTTRDEIEAFLKVTGKSDAFYASFKSLACSLDTPTLACANRLFFQKGFKLLDTCPFLDSTTPLDFVASDAAKNAVNAWVKEATRGGIPQFLDDPLTADTILFLVTAAHFKADWQHPFKAQHTYEGTWNLSEEESFKCNMMMMTVPRDSTDVRVGNSDTLHYRLLSLPYASDFAFLVLIPSSPGDLANIEDGLTSAILAQDLKAAQKASGFEIHLPKFKLSFDADLEGMMHRLGIKTVFDQQLANFGGMIEGGEAFVSKAVHKAVVDVDEKGTEASAATGFAIQSRCMPPRIVVNTPSIFFIIHSPTSTPIFGGRLARPPVTN